MNREDKIIRRIREGDIVQFESLFRSSYVPLVKYANKLLNDYDDAEEIVQDLFVRIWLDRNKINIESSLNGYLYKSVYNRCLHLIDHNKVVEKHKREAMVKQNELPQNPVEIVQYKELNQRIIKILEKLPERCGMIFCMNRFEGLKYSEIAQKLSVSIKTVEASMGKALKLFRKELAE